MIPFAANTTATAAVLLNGPDNPQTLPFPFIFNVTFLQQDNVNEQPLTLHGFNVNLFIINKRQQRHRRVDGFADELDVWRISRVHLETSKQSPLGERKRMIAQECVVIA